MAKMKKKPAGVQGIEVKTHCAASTQEAGANPDVRLGAAAAESSTLQKKKCVLSRFTHGCVSMPMAVHYRLCTRVKTLDRPWCSKSMLQGNTTSESHHNITHCSQTDEERRPGTSSVPRKNVHFSIKRTLLKIMSMLTHNLLSFINSIKKCSLFLLVALRIKSLPAKTFRRNIKLTHLIKSLFRCLSWDKGAHLNRRSWKQREEGDNGTRGKEK